jgi:TolA-binding protein
MAQMTTHSSLAQNGIVVLSAAGGISGISAYLTYRIKRREIQQAGTQNMAAVAKTLTDTSLALLEPVRKAAIDAEARVAALQKQVQDLEAAVDSLTGSLATLTARARTEREQMQQQLEEVTADRERLAAQLADRDAEIAGLRGHGANTA